MYEGIDEDLAKNFDPKKLASKVRIPKFPDVDNGSFECLMKRIEKKTTDKGKKLYEFKFQVTKSNNELVLEGATYTRAYFPDNGNGPVVDHEIFWKNITAPLMAVLNHTDVVTFQAVEELAGLLKICKDDESLELNLPFRLQTKLRPATANKKTGKFNPKHLDENGKPRVFCDDTFLPAAPAAAPATATT